MKTIRGRVNVGVKAEDVFNNWLERMRDLQEGWIELTLETVCCDRPKRMTYRVLEGAPCCEALMGTFRFLYIAEKQATVIYMHNIQMKRGYRWLEPVALLGLRYLTKRWLQRSFQKQYCLQGV